LYGCYGWRPGVQSKEFSIFPVKV
jgi:hypothetical protein